jgi:hypothetical protein
VLATVQFNVLNQPFRQLNLTKQNKLSQAFCFIFPEDFKLLAFNNYLVAVEIFLTLTNIKN